MTRPQLNSITRLARAGALEHAWALFHAGGYMSGSDDPDALTVLGRLFKDRAARETGAAREELLNSAIAAYARASQLSHATYPLINAATLAFLAGRREQARGLAGETLALLDRADCAPETPYWRDATRAEALLLLDRVDEADRVLGQAILHQPQAWEDHASTLRQFSLIMEDTDNSGAWLDRYRPPPALHFEGILGISADDGDARGAIDERLAAISPGYIIGAIAAGADILIAEAAIRNGSQLHVVLPCPPELFCEESIRPFGSAWQPRFERLMGEAASVLVLDGWQPLSNASVDVAREAAMGLAIRESQRLQSFASALRVCAHGEAAEATGVRDWERLGLPVHRIWIGRSNGIQVALTGQGERLALLAVPDMLEAVLLDSGTPPPLGRKGGYAVFGFSHLARAALTAQALKADYPDAGIGLDYRAISRREPHWDRVLALSASGMEASVALSEAAALALALQSPAANVQPMGDMRTAAGDLSCYGLFPDSGDQFSE